MPSSELEAVLTQTKVVDKTGSRVQNMFSQIAPRYDLMNHVLSAGIDIRWRKKVVSLLRLDGTLPVLDCCTGTGDLALLIARKKAGDISVVGSDFCGPMLDIAKRKHSNSCGELPVNFVQADSQELPFEANSFQAVTVAFGLRNVQDTDQGIREMLRVCAPGGQVCVLEFSKPTLPGFRQAYQAYFKHVLPRVGQAVAKNNQDAYDYLPNSVMEFPSGQDLARRMEELGVADVKVIPLTMGIASIYIGDKPMSDVGDSREDVA